MHVKLYLYLSNSCNVIYTLLILITLCIAIVVVQIYI